MVRMTTVPALFPPPDYSHAAVVEAGERLVFLAGAVPLDAAGALIGADDRAAQARQVLANMRAALAAVGSDLGRVFSSTVYVVGTDPAELEEAWAVVSGSELAGGPAGPHASTLLGVSALGYPGQLVEITGVASVPA